MKSFYKQKNVHVIGLHLLLIFCVLFGGHVSAENNQGAEVRLAYQNVLDATEAIAKHYGITGAEDLFSDARDALASATDSSLAPLTVALPEIRKWQQATEKAYLKLPTPDAKSKHYPEGKALSLDKSDPFPEADYYWPLRSSELAMFIGLEVMNTAEGVQMIADRGCQQVAVVAGFGANTSLACLVSDAIFIVAKFVWTSLERTDTDFTSEEVQANYQRLGHLHDDLTAVKDVVDGIYDTLMTHVAEFRAWIKLDLRTKIENNLARHGQQVHPLASFILPQQHGGHLEVVRDIVAETIANMIAAGQRVFFAEAQMLKGDDEFAAGNYKKAYDYYGEAYLSATK